MFKVDSLILDLMEIDPRKIDDKNFYALHNLRQLHRESIARAEKLQSHAFNFYFLILTFY